MEVDFTFRGIKIGSADANRLAEDCQLNDNIMDFYMQFLARKLTVNRSQYTDKVYFFNCHFHAALEAEKLEGSLAKRWERNVQFFTKSVIFIPYNEEEHWLLFVLVNLPHAFGPGSGAPLLFFLDSYPGPPPPKNFIAKLESFFMHRAQYEEHRFLVPIVAGATMKPWVHIKPDVPTQNNESDCGVYVLHYMELMCLQPYMEMLLQSPTEVAENTSLLAFDKSTVSAKRRFITGLLIGLSTNPGARVDDQEAAYPVLDAEQEAIAQHHNSTYPNTPHSYASLTTTTPPPEFPPAPATRSPSPADQYAVQCQGPVVEPIDDFEDDDPVPRPPPPPDLSPAGGESRSSSSRSGSRESDSSSHSSTAPSDAAEKKNAANDSDDEGSGPDYSPEFVDACKYRSASKEVDSDAAESNKEGISMVDILWGSDDDDDIGVEVQNSATAREEKEEEEEAEQGEEDHRDTKVVSPDAPDGAKERESERKETKRETERQRDRERREKERERERQRDREKEARLREKERARDRERGTQVREKEREKEKERATERDSQAQVREKEREKERARERGNEAPEKKREKEVEKGRARDRERDAQVREKEREKEMEKGRARDRERDAQAREKERDREKERQWGRERDTQAREKERERERQRDRERETQLREKERERERQRQKLTGGRDAERNGRKHDEASARDTRRDGVRENVAKEGPAAAEKGGRKVEERDGGTDRKRQRDGEDVEEPGGHRTKEEPGQGKREHESGKSGKATADRGDPGWGKQRNKEASEGDGSSSNESKTQGPRGAKKSAAPTKRGHRETPKQADTVPPAAVATCELPPELIEARTRTAPADDAKPDPPPEQMNEDEMMDEGWARVLQRKRERERREKEMRQQRKKAKLERTRADGDAAAFASSDSASGSASDSESESDAAAERCERTEDTSTKGTGGGEGRSGAGEGGTSHTESQAVPRNNGKPDEARRDDRGKRDGQSRRAVAEEEVAKDRRRKDAQKGKADKEGRVRPRDGGGTDAARGRSRKQPEEAPAADDKERGKHYDKRSHGDKRVHRNSARERGPQEESAAPADDKGEVKRNDRAKHKDRDKERRHRDRTKERHKQSADGGAAPGDSGHKHKHKGKHKELGKEKHKDKEHKAKSHKRLREAEPHASVAKKRKPAPNEGKRPPSEAKTGPSEAVAPKRKDHDQKGPWMQAIKAKASVLMQALPLPTTLGQVARALAMLANKVRSAELFEYVLHEWQAQHPRHVQVKRFAQDLRTNKRLLEQVKALQRKPEHLRNVEVVAFGDSAGFSEQNRQAVIAVRVSLAGALEGRQSQHCAISIYTLQDMASRLRLQIYRSPDGRQWVFRDVLDPSAAVESTVPADVSFDTVFKHIRQLVHQQLPDCPIISITMMIDAQAERELYSWDLPPSATEEKGAVTVPVPTIAVIGELAQLMNDKPPGVGSAEVWTAVFDTLFLSESAHSSQVCAMLSEWLRKATAALCPLEAKWTPLEQLYTQYTSVT